MATKKAVAPAASAKPKAKPKKLRKAGAGRGRRFAPTDEQRLIVESLVAVGTHQALIAEELKISQDTLQRHFRDELDRGKDRALGRLGGMVFRQALGGCRSSQFFVLKTQGGWRTTERHEHSGPGGAPIPVGIGPRYDLANLTKGELKTFQALAKKAAALALAAPDA